MKAIIIKQPCNYAGHTYDAGDELKGITKENAADIRKMNEKGFIEPLTQKELEQIADGSFFNEEKKEEE